MGLFNDAIEGIIATAENRRAQEARHEKDYIGDGGLLFCGTCHTRRQMPLEIPLVGSRIVPVLCKCETEARERAEAERKAQEHRERLNRLRQMGITDAAYERMTFAADDGSDPKTGGIVRRYVEKRQEIQEKNIGLLFHGGVGGGKTYWAACIANAMIDAGTSAMITTIPALIKAMQANFEEDKGRVLDQITQTRFLILDDVGFERQTPYADEKLYEIINARYLAQRPLIITTNLTLEEIKNPSSMEYKRPFDRIMEMCTPIHISAEGRRQAIARDKSDAARNILGL